MSKFITPRLTRVAVGLTVLSVFAAAPMAAQAAPVDSGSDSSTVLVEGGDLTLSTAPLFGNFPNVTLDGISQNVTALSVGDWQVSDATGSALGWSVNVSADTPQNADASVSMTGAALALDAPTPTSVGANATGAPAVQSGNLLAVNGVTVADADTGDGVGAWNLAQDDTDLVLTVPADAKAESYTTTITTTLNDSL